MFIINILKAVAAIIGFMLMAVGCVAAIGLFLVCLIPIGIICIFLFAGIGLMGLSV